MTKLVPLGAKQPKPKPMEPFAQYGDLLTVADLCEIMGLSDRVIRLRLSTGELPGVKIGGVWRIPKKKLIEAVGLIVD